MAQHTLELDPPVMPKHLECPPSPWGTEQAYAVIQHNMGVVADLQRIHCSSKCRLRGQHVGQATTWVSNAINIEELAARDAVQLEVRCGTLS